MGSLWRAKQCCDPDSLKFMNARYAETISLVCFGVFLQVTEKIASVHSTLGLFFIALSAGVSSQRQNCALYGCFFLPIRTWLGSICEYGCCTRETQAKNTKKEQKLALSSSFRQCL